MDVRRWTRTAAVTAGCATLAALSLGAKAPPTATPIYPDVIEAIPDHLQIQNTQQGEWLRFTTVHINRGPGDLQIRGGGQIQPCVIAGQQLDQCTVATQELLDANRNVVATHPAGVAFFHAEHNHWHQSAVAEFQVKKGDPVTGESVAQSTKITFCFVDVEFIGATGMQKKQLPRRYFECNGDFQGLAAGWGDSYHQSTPLQELEVTGLAEGEYYLTHNADPENHWLEGPTSSSPGEMNNFEWVKFRLDRSTGANPSIVILGHSPCDGAECGFGGNP